MEREERKSIGRVPINYIECCKAFRVYNKAFYNAPTFEGQVQMEGARELIRIWDGSLFNNWKLLEANRKCASINYGL